MSHTGSITMAAAYLFFNYNSILVCEISFSIVGTLKIKYPRVLAKGFTLCNIDRSNQPLWKINGTA